MKALIYLLILTSILAAEIPSITTTENSITLKGTTPTFTEQESEQQLFGERCVTLIGEKLLYQQMPGRPELPYLTHTLILPFGKEIDSISVNGELPQKISLSGPLSYALKLYRTDKEVGETIVDTSYYRKQSAPFRAELNNKQIQHGISVVSIGIHPFIYDPINKSISIVEEYVVTITLKDAGTNRQMKSFPDRLPVGQFTLNRDALASYPNSNIRQNEQYDWLAISDIFNTTSQAMSKLVKHREEQGLKCKVVDVETIGTTAQEIRTFIRDQYLNHGIKYVLLAGDETTIPPFRINVFHGIAFKMDTITTDVPFQCLDDVDWEEVYYDEPGFADYSAEVNIGRILCSDMFDFIHQTEKILKYEQLGSTEQALGTFLGLSQKMDEDDWGKPFIENTHAVIPNTITKELLCEEDEMWYDDDFINSINSNRFTVVNHKGHAGSGSIMKLMGAGALTNEVPLFVKSQGCSPAAFHLSSETITEKLTLAPHGFFAVTLNTHYGWYSGNGKGSSQTVTEHFWRGHFEEGIRTFSAMTEYSHRACMNHSSWDMIYLWDMLSSNYFGDPATPCRTPKGAESIEDKSLDQGTKSRLAITQIGTQISIQTNEQVTLSLFNAQGKIVHSRNLPQGVKNHRVDINTLSLASGLYIIKAETALASSFVRAILK